MARAASAFAISRSRRTNRPWGAPASMGKVTKARFSLNAKTKALLHSDTLPFPHFWTEVFMVSSTDLVKRHRRAMISRFGTSNDIKGLAQVLNTLLPLMILWGAVALYGSTSGWVVVAAVPLMTLFTLRVFALMHECGHGSLFRTRRLNRALGFLLGVISGMPQYVWSQHHNYHHAHNGNWQKYRGPYATLSIDEYAALTGARQRMYRFKCAALVAPLAGFIYLIFNPRVSWLKGSIGLMFHL